MCFLGYFEYIYSRFSLVFHVSKVFLGISFSQMIFRSAEKTLFLSARRSEEVCPKDEQTLENGMSACRHSLFPLYSMSFRCQKRHVKMTRKRRPMLARPLLFYGCPPPDRTKRNGKCPVADKQLFHRRMRIAYFQKPPPRGRTKDSRKA